MSASLRSLRRLALCSVCCALFAGAPRTASAQKTLLMHYMPWYQAPGTHAFWGKHWTGFNNEANPEMTGPDGLPDIWSHYHPLIGPYDSSDPDVLECHLLQMKLAGVDGVIVDWYGISSAADYPLAHEGTQAMFAACAQFGMKFSVCFEDRTIQYLVEHGALSPSGIPGHMTSTWNWMQSNWFSQPQYFQKDGRPLLLNFGPIYVTDGNTWDSTLNSLPTRPAFFALRHLWQSAHADGGFAWVHTTVWDGNPSEALIKQRLTDLYNITSSDPNKVIPSAVSGFDDIYVNGYPDLDYRDGATLREALEVGIDGPWPITQLVTWNDYGEGTMIEPTYERGYLFLEVIQQERIEEIGPTFTFTPEDLRLPAELFALRKEGVIPDATLDQISADLSSGDVAAARYALNTILGASFSGQPIDAIANPGGSLVFTATVEGGASGLDLQWTRDGAPLTDDARISGATTETLTVALAGAGDIGEYRLQVMAGSTMAESDPAIGAVRGSPDPNDVNGDGAVDVIDVLELLGAFPGS